MRTKLQVAMRRYHLPLRVVRSKQNNSSGNSVNDFRVKLIDKKYPSMKPSRMKLRRKMRRDCIFSEYGWGILGGTAGEAMNQHLWKKPRKITRHSINDLDLRLLTKRMFASLNRVNLGMSDDQPNSQ